MENRQYSHELQGLEKAVYREMTPSILDVPPYRKGFHPIRKSTDGISFGIALNMFLFKDLEVEFSILENRFLRMRAHHAGRRFADKMISHKCVYYFYIPAFVDIDRIVVEWYKDHCVYIRERRSGTPAEHSSAFVSSSEDDDDGVPELSSSREKESAAEGDASEDVASQMTERDPDDPLSTKESLTVECAGSERDLAEVSIAKESAPVQDVSTENESVPVQDVSIVKESVPDEDVSLSRQSVPDEDVSLSRQSVPEKDVSLSRRSVPEKAEINVSLWRRSAPGKDVSLSRQSVPEKDVSLSRQSVPEKDVSLSRQSVPEKDVSLSRQSVPDEDVVLGEADPSEEESVLGSAKSGEEEQTAVSLESCSREIGKIFQRTDLAATGKLLKPVFLDKNYKPDVVALDLDRLMDDQRFFNNNLQRDFIS